jgi:hypothetical protein
MVPPPGTNRFNDLARLLAGFVVSGLANGGLMGEVAHKNPQHSAPLITRQVPPG